jgi:hypothetical protein
MGSYAMTANKYWDIRRTLTHNCLFNFIIGNRGAGKTFGSLDYAIDKHLKEKAKGRNWQFLYVRRLTTELEKLTIMRGGRLFKSVEKKYPDHVFKAESNILTCDKKVMGYAVPLSTASIMKSDSFPDVQMIIFDEFIIDNSGTYHYLKDEVRKFLDLYETVARPGTNHPPVIVFFLSNAVSIANPYFDYFYLNKPYHGEFQKFGKTKDILVQNVEVSQLKEDKHNSRFGQLIDGSEYSAYAIDNEWLLDNNDFIEKKTQRCEYRMSLRYKDTWLGVWYDPVQWLYFISTDVDLSHPAKYSATTDDHKPNIMLMRLGKSLSDMKHLTSAYNMGAVRYESIKIKNWFRDIMRMQHAS